MKVCRSQYWYKDKTWFSDYPYSKDVTCEDRLKQDIKIFAQETGLKLSHAKGLIRKATNIKNNIPSYMWMAKFGWTMEDLGIVETSELTYIGGGLI